MMCCIDGEQGAFQILPWLLAAGEQGDTLGGKATEEAFGFLQTLVQDGSISENCINLTQTDLAREFIAGKTAMMQNGPWIFPALKEAGVSYGVTGIPGKNKDNAVVGGENIGILKGKNVEGSAAFMKFLMEGNSLEEFCRQASVLTPKIKSAGELDREEEALQVFEQQMEHAVTRTSIPSWSSVSKKLTGGMFGIISGEMNARDAAKLFRKS